MPNGAKLDLSNVGQDSGFRNATPADRIAYLSSVDPDFAKASPADKGAYINHLLGFDQPTQFEQQRAPANQKGFWGTVGEKLSGLIPTDPTGGYPLSDRRAWIRDVSVETPPIIKQATRPIPQMPGGQAGRAIYRGATTLSPLVPFLNPEGSERASETGDTGAVAAEAVMPAAAAAGPMFLREGLKGVAPKVSSALESSAAANYEDVLNPTTKATKFQTQKIMPQLLEERPVAMTRKGLAEKAAGQAEAAGQQIGEQVSGLQSSMKTQPVIDRLENLRQQYQVNGTSLRPEVDSAINTLQDQLRSISKPGEVPSGAEGPGEATISNQDVVRARRILDDAVSEAKGYQGAQLSEASLANIRKVTANSFREELASSNPSLAAVNAKFHFWSTLSDVLDQTIQRKTGQVNALPKVETVIAGAGGLAKGGLGAGIGYAAAARALGAAIRSTGWRTVSAATKGAITDALASGRFDQVVNLVGKSGQVAAAGAAESPAPADDETTGAALYQKHGGSQVRESLKNPVTQDILQTVAPNLTTYMLKRASIADMRRYARGRRA